MRFLAAFLGTTFVLTCLYVLALNLVNPRDEFAGHRFPAVFLDVRREKMDLFERYNRTAPVRGIILGSSTSMTLPPDVLTQRDDIRFFNLAVHAGKLEDYLALFRWTRSQDPAVRTVVLGLDQWALSVRPREQFFEDNWDLVTSLEPERGGAWAHLRHVVSVYHRAFTIGYAMDMLKSIRLRLHPETPIQILHSDGGMHYERWDGEIAAGTYARDAIIGSCIENQMGSQVDSAISQERKGFLTTLFREAAADSVHLVVFVTPIHPRVGPTPLGARLRGGSLASLRALLPTLATRYGGTVLDFSSVDHYGGDPTHWYDCMHMGVDDSHRVADSLAVVIGQRVARGVPSGL